MTDVFDRLGGWLQRQAFSGGDLGGLAGQVRIAPPLASGCMWGLPSRATSQPEDAWILRPPGHRLPWSAGSRA